MKQSPVIALPEKLVERFCQAYALDPHETNLAIKQCTDRLGRLIGRKERQAEEGWQEYRLRPARGPALNFTGRLLYEAETPEQRRSTQRFVALYETTAGAYVVELHVLSSGQEEEIMLCEAFPPQEDAVDRYVAIMQFLFWSYEARTMEKKLGWVMERTIP